jgi:hypothetical protein
MSRISRLIAGGLAVVVIAGAAVLIFGPARGLRDDIAAQRRLITKQVAIASRQLRLQRAQLRTARHTQALARRQLRVATSTRAVALRTLVIARDTQRTATVQLSVSQQLRSLSRELESVARATLHHAARLDHKVVGPVP